MALADLIGDCSSAAQPPIASARALKPGDRHSRLEETVGHLTKLSTPKKADDQPRRNRSSSLPRREPNVSPRQKCLQHCQSLHSALLMDEECTGQSLTAACDFGPQHRRALHTKSAFAMVLALSCPNKRGPLPSPAERICSAVAAEHQEDLNRGSRRAPIKKIVSPRAGEPLLQATF
ncbi:hypothetical protein MTO96_031772 [Rhipicephalus appendiculatus]